MTLKLRLTLVAAAQTVVLVSMIGMKQWTLDTGTPVVLETRPIDPRSLFRGDYVRLNYAIGTLRLNRIGGERGFPLHSRVYVLLKSGTPYWRPLSIHHAMPPLSPGEVAIKGKVTGSGNMLWNRAQRKKERAPYLRVHYGIENYFVPEGAGRKLERPRPGQKLSIQLAVDRFGNAGIKAVLLNGKTLYSEHLF